MKLISKHKDLLGRAVQAIQTRDYWSAYAEMPSPRVYGENAKDDGEAAFKELLGQSFELDQPGQDGWIGEEEGPFGIDLNVDYPECSADDLIKAAEAAQEQWVAAGPELRAAVCSEILERLNKQSFMIANSVMHTTGQAFMMAFQAGGPHAQDRGLEAIAYALDAMRAVPQQVLWEKPQGKNPPLKVEKQYHIVPRGVSLVIGCATFPTWNSYPGLFASLVTGNPVLVKPHPKAVLPLALTVRIAREVLKEEGFDPNLLALLTDRAVRPVAQDVAQDPRIRIVDFTGSSLFGKWLEKHARQAKVYTEKAGVNAVVIDDFQDVKGMCRNLAFTFSLYSGQMCTTPQNVFIPKGGIRAGEDLLSFDEVAAAISGGIEKFLSDPARAVEVLGAIQSEDTLNRIEEASKTGDVVLESREIEHPYLPNARVRTPLVLKVSASEREIYAEERFGPIIYLVATEDREESISLMQETIQEQGAITAAVYADDPEVQVQTEKAALSAGVSLSINLTGGLFVNQSAAFSDFHATGANPAANAALTDPAFVAERFRVVQTRRMMD